LINVFGEMPYLLPVVKVYISGAGFMQ